MLPNLFQGNYLFINRAGVAVRQSFLSYYLCEDTPLMTYHIYKDRASEWRWRLKASNGKIIADSGEGYRNRQDCLAGIQLVKESTQAPILEAQLT